MDDTTVGELLDWLAGQPQDRLVNMSVDAKGDRFGPLTPGERVRVVLLGSTVPDPTWDHGDPRPRWQAGEWATRFHPKREPQMWTVALEYGDPDHCWWMSPGEARALAEALLAAAEWTQEG